jgi:integrase
MRLLASELKARARLGQDIIADERAAQKKASPPTLGEIVPKYLAVKRLELRARSFAEVDRHIQQAWKPLHKRALGSISRADIVEEIDKLEHSRGKVAVDRARTSLSTLFAWAIDRGYCEANPTVDIKARAQDVGRSRVLSEAELVEVWNACLDDDYGRIVRLLILTGQRKTEIGNLTCTEICVGGRHIDLPGLRTRNGRAHIVPLSDQAFALLPTKSDEEDRDLLFGKGAGGFSGWSKAKRELDLRLARRRRDRGVKRPMPGWVIHDLRRSFVTHMNERGFALPHVIEAIVNHTSGHLAGVAGVYNKAQYLDERREALSAWAAHVERLTSVGGPA